jgi:hypothetical protein
MASRTREHRLSQFNKSEAIFAVQQKDRFALADSIGVSIDVAAFRDTWTGSPCHRPRHSATIG